MLLAGPCKDIVLIDINNDNDKYVYAKMLVRNQHIRKIPLP